MQEEFLSSLKVTNWLVDVKLVEEFAESFEALLAEHASVHGHDEVVSASLFVFAEVDLNKVRNFVNDGKNDPGSPNVRLTKHLLLNVVECEAFQAW